MRYYAGNWAYNVWLVKKNGCRAKFDKLKKSSTTVLDQMEGMIDDPVQLDYAKAMLGVMRFMHLQGRPLLEALPEAVDDIEEYEWQEGELLGGAILGWNFGDGHLNGEQLLRAIQPICGFEEGELRVISVESQPLFDPTMRWQVFDAATGKLAEGKTELLDYVDQQAWPTGEFAERLRPGGGAAKA